MEPTRSIRVYISWFLDIYTCQLKLKKTSPKHLTYNRRLITFTYILIRLHRQYTGSSLLLSGISLTETSVKYNRTDISSIYFITKPKYIR